MVRHDTFLTWTVDGVPFLDLLPVSPGGTDVATPLGHDGLATRLGANYLRTLLDEVVDPEWGTTRSADRVVVAFCSGCFGPGCPAVTAHLRVRGDLVTWVDVRWTGPALADDGVPGLTWTFDRAQYERLLESLLVDEQLRLRSAR